MDQQPTAIKKTKLEEIQERRAARAAKAKQEEADRDLADLEALDALEEQHGVHKIRRVDTPAAPPLPGFVVIRAADKAEYASWQNIVMKPSAKASEKKAAMEDLAKDVLLYPDGDTYDRLVEACPGLPALISVEALKLSGGAASETGKE